jgi:hypothetical protein
MAGPLGVVVGVTGARGAVLRGGGTPGGPWSWRPRHGNVVGVEIVVVVVVVVVGPFWSCEPQAATDEPMATAAVRPSPADHRRAPFHVRRVDRLSVWPSMFAMPRVAFVNQVFNAGYSNVMAPR